MTVARDILRKCGYWVADFSDNEGKRKYCFTGGRAASVQEAAGQVQKKLEDSGLKYQLSRGGFKGNGWKIRLTGNGARAELEIEQDDYCREARE